MLSRVPWQIRVGVRNVSRCATRGLSRFGAWRDNPNNQSADALFVGDHRGRPAAHGFSSDEKVFGPPRVSMTFRQVSKGISIRPADAFSRFPAFRHIEVDRATRRPDLLNRPAMSAMNGLVIDAPAPWASTRERPSSGPSIIRESDGIIGSRRDRQRGRAWFSERRSPYNFFLASEQPLRERFYLEAIPFNTGDSAARPKARDKAESPKR